MHACTCVHPHDHRDPPVSTIFRGHRIVSPIGLHPGLRRRALFTIGSIRNGHVFIPSTIDTDRVHGAKPRGSSSRPNTNPSADPEPAPWKLFQTHIWCLLRSLERGLGCAAPSGAEPSPSPSLSRAALRAACKSCFFFFLSMCVRTTELVIVSFPTKSKRAKEL